jgi:hypothetical protein
LALQKDLGFTIVTGTQYLGGFVGKELDQNDRIVKQAKKWTNTFGELTMW